MWHHLCDIRHSEIDLDMNYYSVRLLGTLSLCYGAQFGVSTMRA